MKYFQVFKEMNDYRLTIVNDDGVQIEKGIITDALLIKKFKAIEIEVDKMKTNEEVLIEELEVKAKTQFEFIKQNATEEQKLSLIDVYPVWKEHHDYLKDDEFSFQGSIFKVLQDHTSQPHWLPNEAVSLYVDIMNKVSLQEFKQPTGSHDAYMIGDKVLWQGEVFRSIIDNNVWSPTDYPQGWEKENS